MQDTLEQRLDFFGLGDGLVDRLAPVSESAGRHIETALQLLSAQASSTPSAARFLYGRERIEGDGGGPASHWRSLIAGQIDKGFAEAATRTGQRHARIGVDPRWHAGSHAIIAQVLVGGVIRDGMATLLKSRRGPLGLLGGPDPAACNDAADALAKGVATLVGAVLFDLDLAYAGHADRLRQDAEARLEAERVRQREAMAAAGRMLNLAAEGQRIEPMPAGDDADLAALNAGAEKLADRVLGLIEDLDLAGRAAETLAADVLAEGKALVEARIAEADALRRLAEDLAETGPRAQVLPGALGAVVRRGKALARRCTTFRRELLRAAPDSADLADLVERVDQLGLSANLIAARLAQGAKGSGDPMDADVRALAQGLAQVSAQLRSDGDKRDSVAGQALRQTDRMVSILEQAATALASDMAVLADLQRQGAGLADSLAQASDLASSLAAGLPDAAGQGTSALGRLALALEGAGALAELPQAFGGEAVPEEPLVYPALDRDAIAAHWHVV